MSKFISLREEINSICKESNITDAEFKEVSKNQWKQIIYKIENEFLAKKSPHSRIEPYWVYLKGDCYTLAFPNDNAFLTLDKLIKKEEKVWFLAQDSNKIWLYEGFIRPIITILKECYAFEYYIVSKKYDWLLCENHEGCLTGTGTEIIERMRKLGSFDYLNKRGSGDKDDYF